MIIRRHYFFLLLILLFALAFRLIGLDWDQDQHLHPDERFLTMVGTAVTWPVSLSQYFNTATSPANPHNQNFGFYVYGTYPVLLVKALSGAFQLADYSHLPLFGRAVSAILDTGTVLLVFFLATLIFSSPKTGLWSAAAYAVSVLPLQLSHFFAVDPYLVFFLTLSFLFFLLFYYSFPSPKSHLFIILTGLSFGLAAGAKISGLIFGFTLVLGFAVLLIRQRKFFPLFFAGLLLIFFFFLSLRINFPYLFSDPRFFTVSLNPKVLANWRELEFESQPNHFAPPSTQWIHLAKGWFPFINLVFVGLGLPLAVAVFLGLILALKTRFRLPGVYLSLFFILSLFVYQSLQFSQPLRYYYPLYPFLAIFAGLALSRLKWFFALLVSLLILIWPASFLTIYTRPHSRVTASAWIYAHIPPGSTLSCEYWDDCLPLSFPGYSGSRYNILQLEPYAAESPQKWAKFIPTLSQVDYLVLSSNRLYASITSDPDYYPQTTRFYQDLFAGKLGFTKIAEFTSRPNLPLPGLHACFALPFLSYGKIAASSDCPLPGLSFIDDYADETLTVYDHPKIIIFQNTGHYSQSQILQLITEASP